MSFKQTQLKSDTLSIGMRELLGEHLNLDDMKELEIGANLSKTQQQAFELFKKGESLLVLGSAGVGKSKLIKTMHEYQQENFKHKHMYITATTGVASYNVSGMTIHSFMGIGTGDQDILFLVKRVFRNKSIVERLRTTDILVIDEISMLSASLFEKINLICQHFRKNKSFMGGIQVILTGDFLQLNPVFNQNPERFTDPEDTRLLVESKQFNEKFNKKNKNIIILKENFRQLNDPTFIDLLLRIREGNQTPDDIQLFKNKCKNFNTELKQLKTTPVHLVSTNKKAQNINETNLNKLTGKLYKYKATFNTMGDNKECIDILKRELDSQFKQKGLIELNLKKDARIMLIKNLDISLGLINGAIGTITDLTTDYVNVLFDNGMSQQITKVDWELEMQGHIVRAKQIPLILAYSITIHKSMSITLECAILELADCFTDSQIYVALSRVKSLDGLLLKSFNENKILINQTMKKYVDSFN